MKAGRIRNVGFEALFRARRPGAAVNSVGGAAGSLIDTRSSFWIHFLTNRSIEPKKKSLSEGATLLFLTGLEAHLSPLTMWAELLLRIVAGLFFVPHGLRAIFGFFAGSGRVSNFTETANLLQSRGFRPGRFWAWVLIFTQFVAAPLLVLGLFTRPAALLCFLFLLAVAFERGRTNGYFWNKQGCEYPLLWAALVLFFVFRGGGPYSIDALLLAGAL